MIDRASRLIHRACCIALTVVALLPLTGQPAGASLPTDLQASQLVTLVNNHRASLGKPPLAWDQRLADVAQAHTEDMVRRGFFSHTNPDGDTFADRIHAANITFVSASENIAAGFSTAQSVFSAWLLSPGHRSNIENGNFTHHGIGFYQNYWTHVFIEAPNSPVGVDGPESAVGTLWLSASPSPARTGGRLSYNLPTSGRVTLFIVDVTGRQVARPLDDALLEQGAHDLAFNVASYRTGMYFVHLVMENAHATTKLLVVR